MNIIIKLLYSSPKPKESSRKSLNIKSSRNKSWTNTS